MFVGELEFSDIPINRQVKTFEIVIKIVIVVQVILKSWKKGNCVWYSRKKGTHWPNHVQEA
jgi:hypothetical protein